MGAEARGGGRGGGTRRAREPSTREAAPDERDVRDERARARAERIAARAHVEGKLYVPRPRAGSSLSSSWGSGGAARKKRWYRGLVVPEPGVV